MSDAAADPPTAEDERRAEIAAKVAALKADRAREEARRTEYFGEHAGISCDGGSRVRSSPPVGDAETLYTTGCGLSAPLVGYRYRCKKCANHDVCESCYGLWDGGNGTVANALNQQKLSPDAKEHYFVMHKDKGFKPLVRGAGAKAVAKKVKPNDPCDCGSGKKYKRCCGSAAKTCVVVS